MIFMDYINMVAKMNRKWLLMLLLLTSGGLLVIIYTVSHMTGSQAAVHQAAIDLDAVLENQPFIRLAENYYSRQWTNFSHLPFEMYVLSAYHDTRPDHGSDSNIRVLVVMEKLKHKVLYCVLTYQDGSMKDQSPHGNLTRRIAKAQDIGLGQINHDKHFVEYVITCKLKKTDNVPSHISIIHGIHGNLSQLVHKPIEIIAQPTLLQDFILCEKATYGDISPYKIIEFVEMNRLLGVNKIVVYTHMLSEIALRTLLHYCAEGIVEVWQSPLFIREDGFSSQVLHDTPVINDCMLRYQQSYRFAVVTDIDEFIVPRSHDLLTLKSLLTRLETAFPSTHSTRRQYVFRNLYFMFENPEDEHMPRYISSLRHRYRGEICDPGYSVKTIIDPRLCIGMHNHYCWHTLNPEPGYNVDVPVEMGLNHHYKPCHLKPQECQPFIKDSYLDDTMLKYKEVLTSAINSQVRLLREKGVITDNG